MPRPSVLLACLGSTVKLTSIMFSTSIAAAIMIVMSYGSAMAGCADDMAKNMEQMVALAGQCGEDADLIASITSNSGRININELSESCRNQVDVTGQLSAFNECSRIYICGAQAYAYALDNLSSYGGDCSAAAEAGLERFPVQ